MYTAAEHKRSDTIPPKVLRDEVQVVQDFSDREDDPSSGDGAEKDKWKPRNLVDNQRGRRERRRHSSVSVQPPRSRELNEKSVESAEGMTIVQKGRLGVLMKRERDQIRDS